MASSLPDCSPATLSAMLCPCHMLSPCSAAPSKLWVYHHKPYAYFQLKIYQMQCYKRFHHASIMCPSCVLHTVSQPSRQSWYGPSAACLVCRRQATAHSSRSDVQSPHASSPNGTSPRSQFGEDRAEQASARPSLDNSAEQPFRSAASDASGTGTPRTPMNGATTPTTSGQAGKAVASQRHQQPQVSMPKAGFSAVTCMYRPGIVFSNSVVLTTSDCMAALPKAI